MIINLSWVMVGLMVAALAMPSPGGSTVLTMASAMHTYGENLTASTTTMKLDQSALCGSG